VDWHADRRRGCVSVEPVKEPYGGSFGHCGAATPLLKLRCSSYGKDLEDGSFVRGRKRQYRELSWDQTDGELGPSFRRRRRRPQWLLVALVVNPQWLHLPGAGALTNFALAIAVYIPAGILIGAALGWLIGHDGWLQIPLFHLMVLFLVIGAGVWGSRLRLRDIAISSGAMVTRPDLRAMAWIQANTPQNSRFLVNSFLANSNSAVVGSDAGWWLPLLAHRPTSLPPDQPRSRKVFPFCSPFLYLSGLLVVTIQSMYILCAIYIQPIRKLCS